MNPMKKGLWLTGETLAGDQRRRPRMLYVGLDLSRKRLDWQALAADGDLIYEHPLLEIADALLLPFKTRRIARALAGFGHSLVAIGMVTAVVARKSGTPLGSAWF